MVPTPIYILKKKKKKKSIVVSRLYIQLHLAGDKGSAGPVDIVHLHISPANLALLLNGLMQVLQRDACTRCTLSIELYDSRRRTNMGGQYGFQLCNK